MQRQTNLIYLAWSLERVSNKSRGRNTDIMGRYITVSDPRGTSPVHCEEITGFY